MKQRTMKLIALFAAVAMVGSLAACGGGDDSKSTSSDNTSTEDTAGDDADDAEDGADDAAAEDDGATDDSASDAGSTPRNETLYFAGQQWGSINDYNPLSANSNNAMGIMQGDSSRTLIYETLFMYNLLDGNLYGLLATDYEWNDDLTAMTIHMNPDAKWNDGTQVLASDVAYTFDFHVTNGSSLGADYSNYIESIEATDDTTVVINCKISDEGLPVNPLQIEKFVQQMYIMQQAYLEKVAERCGNDPSEIKMDTMEDMVSSGPYKPYIANDQKVVFQRDDNYWGQADSMWGTLPAPKYIAHTIFSGNDTATTALQQGEVDVAQLFITDVQKLWEDQGLPISTYLDEAPYNQSATMPTVWFNCEKEGLDQVAVRKAIAIATDYDQILASAMSNQAVSFDEVPRSVLNPTDAEQAMYNQEEVADLQWTGKDIEGAKALLDEAGIVDNDGDGIREYNGKNLTFQVECPSGWTDWNASLEIVAAAGKEIGINLETYFPETNTYNTDLTTCNFDIIMQSVSAGSPSNPWGRAMQYFSSTYIDLEANWSGNYGHYINEEADEILAKIPNETDEETLKEYYTRLTEIYLTDVPSFAVMYRPQLFYTLNESVWTNYPAQDTNDELVAAGEVPIPPTDCTDGYGIAALYQLELVE